MTLGDEFMEHVDKCPDCCWVTAQFCSKARTLLDATAQRAAEHMAPIPVVLPRPDVKA